MYQENAWKKYSDESLDKLMKFNDDYKNYLSNSKTERLCVKNAVKLAEANGFVDIKSVERGKNTLEKWLTNKEIEQKQ